jgi:hypothetical protein
MCAGGLLKLKLFFFQNQLLSSFSVSLYKSSVSLHAIRRISAGLGLDLSSIGLISYLFLSLLSEIRDQDSPLNLLIILINVGIYICFIANFLICLLSDGVSVSDMYR